MDLSTFVLEVTEGFKPLAASKRVRLAVNIPAREVIAIASADGLRQVMLNLLDNAVKFGPPDDVVTVSLETSGGTARLTVEDRGAGVPVAARRRIFEPFERGEARGSGGAGIGLAVVRRIVTRTRRHGDSRGSGLGRRAIRRLVAAGPRRATRIGGKGRMSMANLLLVEDNADLAYGLRNNLEIDGHIVDTVETGEAALERVRHRAPDLIVLDLMLPNLDGYQVLRRLRADGHEMPVLILTARTQEADKVLGFRLGADDYVTKPFGVLEVLARISALLRRANRYASLKAVERFGEIEVNRDTRIVSRAGRPVDVSPMEFALLIALMARRGATASRLDLLQEVWGHSAAVVTRTVDTHIAELRRKLEVHPAHPVHILTVRKVGYRLAGGPPAASPSA